MSAQEVSFSELLAINEGETNRWREWFERQPASVFDLPIATANAGTVRGLLLHIFAVELRYAERLSGKTEVTNYENLPTDSVEALFGIGARARELFRQYFASATDEDLRTVMEFQTRSAGVFRSSKRKVVLHALNHGVRHWAQLAVALREAGYKTDWMHDVLGMPEMQ